MTRTWLSRDGLPEVPGQSWHCPGKGPEVRHPETSVCMVGSPRRLRGDVSHPCRCQSKHLRLQGRSEGSRMFIPFGLPCATLREGSGTPACHV